MIRWVLIIVLVFPAYVFAGEYCAENYNGICRDVCLKGETPADGGFIDCTDKQVCCVKTPAPEKAGASAPAGSVTMANVQDTAGDRKNQDSLCIVKDM
jgi:hypothetical protein